MANLWEISKRNPFNKPSQSLPDARTLACASGTGWSYIPSQLRLWFNAVLSPSGSEETSCEFGSGKYYALCGFGGILSCGITHTALVPLDMVKCRIQVRFLRKIPVFFLSRYIANITQALCRCVVSKAHFILACLFLCLIRLTQTSTATCFKASRSL